jgi:3-oxoacyl-[acyl-carrier protein] reductase
MTTETKTLTGKVALVTGGSRGIGAAIVRRLAADGAAVAFTYANSQAKADDLAAEINGAGGKALAIKADSADAEAVQAAVAQTVRELGGLDILVNNAGILLGGLLGNLTLDDFDRITAVNVRAVFVGSQAAAAVLPRGGRIITIGSCVADRGNTPGISLYGMSKAAVAGLTRGLAGELGPRGITVNTVQPGPTETDMNPGDGPNAERLKALIPVGRLGQDDEVASLVAYLAGPQSSFVNGAALTVDGGYNA